MLKNFFNNISVLQSLCLTFLILLVTLFSISVDVCDNYHVLNSIIIHDYGQSFDSIEQWLQWRFDNER